MKKCPFCDEKIKNNAKVCRYCGRELPPVSKRVKLFSTLFTGAFMLCCFTVGIVGLITTQSPEYQAEKTQTAAWETAHPPSTRTPTPIPGLSLLTSVANLPAGDAKTAFSIIQSVGFSRIDELTLQIDTEGRTHYLAYMGYKQPFILTIENNQVVFIGRDTMTLYDVSQGGVVDNIKNYVLQDTERSTFSYLAQQHVLTALKSPSTAEFPSLVWNAGEWSVSRDHDVITVRSWVDAQNSFGAMIRSHFTAQYSYATQDMLYLVIDNSVIYGSPAEP